MILRLHSKRLTERDYDTTSERFEIKSAAQSVGALSFLLSPYLLTFLSHDKLTDNIFCWISFLSVYEFSLSSRKIF